MQKFKRWEQYREVHGYSPQMLVEAVDLSNGTSLSQRHMDCLNRIPPKLGLLCLRNVLAEDEGTRSTLTSAAQVLEDMSNTSVAVFCIMADRLDDILK
jgi:hypothetical protein